jgi:ATP-dependent DNA helicase RecQ
MTTSTTPTPDADRALLEALQRVWGFAGFRPHQRDAMHAVLAGRDSVVILPTGGGKSLCFQAPALVDSPTRAPDGRRGFALVVSPLISLMKDQVDGLRVDGVSAAYLNSTQSPDEREAVVRSLRSDGCRLLYASPERVVGEGGAAFRRLIRECGVRFIAIDEAHCISQWGHDFRPEYRQLGLLRDELPAVSLHAFTATATERVRRDIATELRLRDPIVLVGSFDRPNLIYRVLRRDNVQRQLQQIIARHAGEPGIVYCPSRREVETIAAWLSSEGRRAVPYHAGLPDATRARHQEDFLDERADIVVATVAFGMGIDRSNVRFVVHTGAPRSPEHYQQEAGRAGRDGLPAECVLLYSGADFLRWRQRLEATGELTDSARTLIRDMERYATATRCRHRTLVEYFGESYPRRECGACDWCLHELEPVLDATTVARKILSCVARVRQGWGTGHVVDVLLGRATEKVVSAGHDALSTFGLLREESAASIRGYIEQLIAGGQLRRDGEPYPVLKLSAAGAALLKGEGACELYREQQPARAPAGRRGRGAAAPVSADQALFDRLREVRLRLARERGVPPYVIFHDTTLREMAAHRPRTLGDLYGIYGVGSRKAADFGEAFLEALREWGPGGGEQTEAGR